VVPRAELGQPPPFERIAIVGVGLIGGSLGLALKRGRYPATIVGVSRPETLTAALKLGAIDVGHDYTELPAALAECDLTILCTPVRRIVELLPLVGRCVRPDGVVTDVGSTKRRICAEAAAALPFGTCFIGGHPMAGAEKAGVAAADPFLFQNAIYIVVPPAQLAETTYQRFLGLLRQLGAKALELDAQTHDQVVAAISHLPQMIATCLVRMVGELQATRPCFLPLAAGGFRDLTRIASSRFVPVWQDICATNGDQLGAMLDRYAAVLADVRARLPDLERDFDQANGIRDSIPRDAKGFLHRLFELLVVAEDRPGVLAEIATALSAEQININDIEIMKVREGVGGTIRLGFDTEAAAERALACLRRIGYQARKP
jgi:prephenate dehydrogenase